MGSVSMKLSYGAERRALPNIIAGCAHAVQRRWLDKRGEDRSLRASDLFRTCDEQTYQSRAIRP